MANKSISKTKSRAKSNTNVESETFDMEEPSEDFQAGDNGNPPPIEMKKSVAVSRQTQQYKRRALFQNIKKHDLVGMEDVRTKKILKPLVGEFVGTLLLVFLACGACLFGDTPTSGASAVAISLAFGLTVATIAQAIGHVSGAHLNPAVSIGLIPAGGCSIMKALAYIFAQILGAICGAAILWAILPLPLVPVGAPLPAHYYLGTTTISKNLYYYLVGGLEYRLGTYLSALVVEIMTTFLLVLLVCGVCDRDRTDVKGSAALAVGLSITVGHLIGCRMTGPSMNPARSIGPAVIFFSTKPGLSVIDRGAPEADVIYMLPIKQLWVYILGPIMGGLLAGTIYRFVFKEDVHPPE